MKPTIAISEIIKSSWSALKSQIWILVGLFIGFIIISLTLSVFLNPADGIVKVVAVNLLSAAVSLIFSLGYIKNMFQALDGIEPQFSAYGQQARKIVTLFVSSLLVSIVVCIGVCLLIVPGVYIALRLQFFQAFIVEEDAGITESIRRSWQITDRQVMPLFLLCLAMIGFMFLGFILLGIGIFVTAPLVYMMYCTAFRKLSARPLEE